MGEFFQRFTVLKEGHERLREITMQGTDRPGSSYKDGTDEEDAPDTTKREDLSLSGDGETTHVSETPDNTDSVCSSVDSNTEANYVSDTPCQGSASDIITSTPDGPYAALLNVTFSPIPEEFKF